MIPLVASRFVSDWNWPPQAFVVVYFLFFALIMASVLIARRNDSRAYKAGVGIALATSFALGWSTMVQVADSGHPENFAYLSALPTGLIGAFLARLRPRGLALTLFAMAATVALIAILLPSGVPPDLARRMAVSHAGAVALFTAAGLLLRRASLAPST